jgi:O-antigen/teichoic acid export membrane protein
MFDFFSTLFSSSDLMPHGYCFLWRPSLLWLHVISDVLITIAYYSLPFALMMLVRKRKDFAYRWILFLFGVFIFLCGTSHLANIWTIWFPDYGLSGLIKAVTGAVSVLTAISRGGRDARVPRSDQPHITFSSSGVGARGFCAENAP